MNPNDIKKAVREAYAKVVVKKTSCCGPDESVCSTQSVQIKSKCMGYTEEELKSVPEGANLGLGCGNPVTIASLKEGQTVVDLGSGGGLDCFLAASKVGDKGKVIGVDMTPEMIDKARRTAEKGGYKNVEFRLGEIEHLPVPDNHVDVVISNCVINLAADKEHVLKEIYRIMKPGGRIAISDLALIKELPPKIRNSIEAYTGCIGGAILLEEYKKAVRGAGFKGIKFTVKTAEDIADADREQMPDELKSLENYVVSVYITAGKIE